ncbi:unnamed protein product [Ambrosiozyma monospora]|uniref:Unnamed protein product n=1 Tax=Ambrosiozyma monospora TaxID=43982 RepID=A0A9W7DFX9_AMBMO|nr:unnamed protein product [Ambrosiozyma monospora]
MQVTPKNLELNAPFTKQSTTTITVSNNSEQPIAFKVKTTAPKLYCVRPNASTISPGESMDVSIIFQGLDSEPAVGSKCKDKFLIVSVPCQESLDPKTISSIWPKLAASGESSDVKLRVVYNFDSLVDPIQEESSQQSIQEHSSKTVSNGAVPAAAGAVAGAGAAAAAVSAKAPSTTINNTTQPVEKEIKATPAVKQAAPPANTEKAPVVAAATPAKAAVTANGSTKETASTTTTKDTKAVAKNSSPAVVPLVAILAIIIAIIAFLLSKI